MRLDRVFREAGNLLASHREPLLSLQFIINGIDLLFFFFDSTDLMVFVEILSALFDCVA